MAKRMTKAQEAKYAKLKEAERAAMWRIFGYAPHRHARWNECYAVAPADVRAAHDAAAQALRDFERDMVAQGRGYFSERGYFYSY